MTRISNEMMWQRKYETLKADIEDLLIQKNHEEKQPCTTRAWDPPERLYVSFDLYTVDTREVANERFGEGHYDVYELKEWSPRDVEKKPTVGVPMGDLNG